MAPFDGIEHPAGGDGKWTMVTIRLSVSPSGGLARASGHRSLADLRCDPLPDAGDTGAQSDLLTPETHAEMAKRGPRALLREIP